MSSICGIHRPDGRPVDAREIGAMLDALDHWQADARGAWIKGGAGLGHLLLHTAGGDPPPQPMHHAESRCTITGDVRLDNRIDLAARLGEQDDAASSDEQLVLRAYARWGDACAAHLVGDFAFAIHDEPRRRMFCARDMFGVRPFYYHHHAGGFAFATQIKGLLALSYVDRTINDIWVADYLHRLAIDRTDTFYTAIRRLEPGHALIAGADGLRIWRYRQFDAERELTLSRDEDYIEAFREKLSRAIQRRIDGIARPGAELSGGLDSSAISALAQRLVNQDGRPLETFAQVQPQGDDADGLPEDARWAIDRVREHSGIQTTFLDGDGGIIASLDWASRVLDEPPRNMVSLYNDDLYEAAHAKDITVLLSGFGGNQGVSAVGFDRRRELLYSGRWIELGREIAARKHKRNPALALLGLLWYEIDWHALDARLGRTRFWARQPERLARTDLARRAGMRDRGLRYVRDDEARGTLREQAIGRLNLPIVAHRLEYAHHATAARRVEYRYPLFDEELIAFYLSVPSHLKYRRGVGRYLFRRMLEGVVPDDVRWEAGPRASANPGAVRRRAVDRDAIVARIAAVPHDSRLFDYVDRDKLAALLGGRGTRPRERFTQMIMTLMLEQKLREAAS